MTDNRVHLIDFAAYLKDLPAVSGADHKADGLLLTCMDFRFFKTIAQMMQQIKYDHVILAGAALGAVVEGKPHWHQTYFDHIDLAVRLHDIKWLLVMEHRDCGAYGPKGFKLLGPNPSPNEEYDCHFKQAEELKRRIRVNLPFSTFLLEKPEGTDALTFDQLI